MIRQLAWRSVTARKLRAILNGGGIVLGVALIFSVLSLSKTIVTTFDDLFGAVYGKTDIVVTGSSMNGTFNQDVLQKVRDTGGVEAAVPEISSVLTLVTNGKAGNGQKDQINAVGINPSDPDLSGSKTVAGRKVKRGNELLLDDSFARGHKIKPGDTIALATQTGVEKFKVSGLMQLGGGIDFGGQGFASVPIDFARKVFAMPTGFSEIDIAAKPGTDIETLRKKIERNAGKGIEAKTPSSISDQINQQLQGFNIILYFFAAMSLFVGGFLILNSFNMTVAQRLREIGMLRTLGGSRGMIARMILVEAIFLGLIGSLLGIGLGLLLSKLMVAMISQIGLPVGAVKYPLVAFVVAPVCGLTATLFGALRPALRAGRIPPIQAVLVEHRARPLRLRLRVVAGAVLVLLGLAGVFTLASSSSAPTPIVLAGAFGVLFLFSGVIMLGPVVVPVMVRALSWPLRRLTPIEGRLAADSARANPLRTASTASGLMIGIALVAAIGSLGSSFIGSVSDDLDRELRNDFTVQPRAMQGGGPQTTIAAQAVGEIGALPGARLATGVHMLFLSAGYGKGSLTYGVDPAVHSRFANPEYVGADVKTVDTALAGGGVVVPEELAKKKHTKVGDTVTLEGPRGNKRLRVAALQPGNSIEASSIVMSNGTFESLYGAMGFTQILVLAKSEGARAQLDTQINDLLDRKYPAFKSLSNADVKKQIKNQINQVFSIFYVIMAVAIIVSLLGVVNTLLMNVLERTREIGVLRAIGSVRWQVRRLIIQESLLLTTSGAILGLAVGMALGYAFVRGIATSAQSVAFHPPVGVILLVALLAVVFGLIAALLPARRAARMNVIEAVSYE